MKFDSEYYYIEMLVNIS